MIRRVLAGVALVACTGHPYALHGEPSERSVWDGVYTQEQAARGLALYGEHCSECHGPTLTGTDAPALTGFAFSANWNSLSLNDLFERIGTMPPNDPGHLNAQQKADLIAYMLSAGSFPAGTEELPRNAQGLVQIRYLATKP